MICMKNNKTSLFYVTLSSLLGIVFSCTIKADKNLITGKLKRIDVNHVIESREGCKFTSLQFYTSVSNNSDIPITIGLPYKRNHCDLSDLIKTNINWISNLDTMSFSLSEKREVKLDLKPNETINLVFKNSFPIQGLSLSQIVNYYKLDSTPVLFIMNDTMVFEGADVEIKYFLDDSLIQKVDTILFNKEISFPALDNLSEIDSLISHELYMNELDSW